MNNFLELCHTLRSSKYDSNKFIFSSRKECVFVEKYYCDRCRLLYNDVEICKICGTLVKNKINIEVQKQPDKK